MLQDAFQTRESWAPPVMSAGYADRMPGVLSNLRQHQHLARGGERPEHLLQILHGWAGRYRLLSDGRRQITGLYLPGDLCDPCWLDGGRSVQSVVALTPIQASRAPRREMETQAAVDASLMKAMWRQAQFSQQVQAEWLVNLGRKNAIERLSHLLCELYTRLSLAGAAHGPSCDMPLTQLDLADIAGLTPVHVNRTLQEMRAMRLIELQSRRLTILDWEALRRIAWFDPTYLSTRGSRENYQAAA
ncbi:MAG: Crp/Fnr family transcriptional regulator [Chakrabartia godavariana]